MKKQLTLSHVIDFLVGIEIERVRQYIADHIDERLADHAMKKLEGYCESKQYISIQAVGMWLSTLDTRHRTVIENYILEYHSNF